MFDRRRVFFILLSVLCIALGTAVFIWVGRQGTFDSFYMAYLLSAILELFFIGIPAFLLLHSGLSLWHSFKAALRFPGKLFLGVSLLAAVSLTMVSGLIGLIWYNLLDSIGYTVVETALPNPGTAVQWIVAMITASIIPAICEELLFRGFLIGLLKTRFSENAVVFLSALFFALCHLNLEGFPSLLFIGIVLAKVMYRQGMIWIPILIHAVYNASSIAINTSGAGVSLLLILLCTVIFFTSMYYLLRKEDVSCS